MAINFKFRSSVAFDSIGIDGPSISIADLRAKIVDQKNLKVCRDFDLVILDAQTGEVFEDESRRIRAGANVILKRVPAAGANQAVSVLRSSSANGPLAKGGDLSYSPRSSPSSNVDMDNFDDFGTDLYIAPEASCLDLGFDENKRQCRDNKQKHDTTERYFRKSVSGCQNVEAEKEKGGRDHVVEETEVKTNLDATSKETAQPDEIRCLKAVDKISSWKQDANLPSELKCSLCKAIFKEALMIPCCQHSFCEKCIRLALVEKARCPQCLSSRCKVDDLLPNVSLRQAIERFLESQLINNLDIAPSKYPPDGESGIQVKESSCAVSIHKGDTQLPHSPSATGQGSNQVYAESVCESLVREKGVSVAHDLQIHTGGNADTRTCRAKWTKNLENDGLPTKLAPPLLQEEAGKKRQDLELFLRDGSVNFASSSRNRKGDRHCYTCGSPDHLVKDCPVASGPTPFVRPGNPSFLGGMPPFPQPYYWQGPSLPHVRPFPGLYGTSGAMPFDANMVPVSPFAVPPYLPHMYVGFPVPCGYTRMSNLAPPMVSAAEHPLSRAEFIKLQKRERHCKFSNDNLDRESYDSDDMVNPFPERHRRSFGVKIADRDSKRSYSEVSEHQHGRKRQRSDKHSDSIACETSVNISNEEVVHSKRRKNNHISVSQRDRHSEKSYSEIQDCSRSSGHHSKGSERPRHWHKSSKKNERSEHSKRNSHRSKKDASSDYKKPDSEGNSAKHHTDPKTDQHCDYKNADSGRHSKKHRSNSKSDQSKKADSEGYSGKHHNHSKIQRCDSSVIDRGKHQYSRNLHAHSSSEQGLHGQSKRHNPEKKESLHSGRHSKHEAKNVDGESGYDRWELLEGSDIDDEDGYCHNDHSRAH